MQNNLNENSKIFKISHILIFFLCAFASLPIFFDLSTGELIFIKNLYVLHPDDRPGIPLPVSTLFFGAILFYKFFPTLNKLLKRKFNIFLFCIFFLSLIGIINGISIFRLLQLILPLIILFTLPIVSRNSTRYCSYAFVYSIFCFSVLHLFYYYQFGDVIECNQFDECNIMFLGYEIYSASVGFPDVIALGLSASLFIFDSINNALKKLLFSMVPIVLLYYLLFLSRASSLLILILSLMVFLFVIILKIIINLKINKFIFFSIISSISLIAFFKKNLMSKLIILPFKFKTLLSGSTPRVEVWKENIYGLLDNPITLLFGGITKQVGGHNYFISILSLIGLVGLILLIICFYLIVIELKNTLKIEGILISEIKLFSIILAISSLLIGSLINDSLTQPLNILSLYAFIISIMSFNDWYINKHKTLNNKINSSN